MLILTRKPGESIILGDNIEIKVLEVSDSRVKLGIEAPRDIKVLRKEVISTIEENKEAAMTTPKTEALKNLLK